MTTIMIRTAQAALWEPLGNVVRRERKARHWTQVKLAERSGIDHETISKIENGYDFSPRLFSIRCILEALGWELALTARKKEVQG